MYTCVSLPLPISTPHPHIYPLQTNENHSIQHFRYTGWTTSGVPKEATGVLDFLKTIKMADSQGPAVVHCSAGIGRTGVLIAIDIGLQAILQGDKTVDVLRIVSTLRQDRSGAVQTKDQYKFVHQALYDVAREEGL
jgi:protein tyrosine phosphatase